MVLAALAPAGARAQKDPDHGHAATGLTFPAQWVSMTRGSVIDYEQRQAGLGESVGYNAPGITATIYLYTMGRERIDPHPDSPEMQQEFARSCREIVQAGEQGLYQDVTPLTRDAVAFSAGDRRALHASYRFRRGDTWNRSHIYLAAYRNHFVKVRFTHREGSEVADRTRAELMAALGRMLD